MGLGRLKQGYHNIEAVRCDVNVLGVQTHVHH
jgi:hypothetical protein